jgi:hypothetical protein
MNTDLIAVEKVSDRLQAEILRGLLAANGVPALLSYESAGPLEGVMLGPMAEVQLLVPAAQAEAARQLLADYHAGRLQQPG